MADLVTLTIDGRTVQVEPGTLLVEAAAQAGILIPVYCYHPKLAPVGACRMCLVEIEGMPKLVASCTTPVKEGMVVHTNNARVEKARRGMLEFLLVHHPLDCPICDKGGECPLQDYTYKFGPGQSRYTFPKRRWEKPLQIGPNILLDRERCIMCFRCVRFCQEISGHEQLGVFERGNGQEIGVHPDQPFDSQFAGNTIELCPVGALTGAPTRFFGRTWEVAHSPGVCTGCAAGCNIRVDTRDGSEVVRYWSRENRHTDDGWLCDAGRFGFGFVNERRLLEPKLKSGEELTNATWQQALVRAAATLSEHSKAGTLGIMASPAMTNENLYAIAKLAREALGEKNLDHSARKRDAALADIARAGREAGFAAGTLVDIDAAARIITIGVDLSREQPVTELRVKKAVRQNGAALISVHGSDVELDGYAAAKVRYEPGKAAAAVEALAKQIAERDEPSPSVVVLGSRLAETEDASLIAALGALARSLGEQARLVAVLPSCNSRGALDLGILPAPDGGLSGAQMLQAARDGRIKALFLAGAEPLLDLDADLVKDALGRLEAIVYMGWAADSLPVSPDVALPCLTVLETGGTFSNTDGRIQRVFRAIRPRGRAKPVWQIAADLAQALGNPWLPASVEEIFEQVTREADGYAGVEWGRLGVNGIHPRALAEQRQG